MKLKKWRSDELDEFDEVTVTRSHRHHRSQRQIPDGPKVPIEHRRYCHHCHNCNSCGKCCLTLLELAPNDKSRCGFYHHSTLNSWMEPMTPNNLPFNSTRTYWQSWLSKSWVCDLERRPKNAPNSLHVSQTITFVQSLLNIGNLLHDLLFWQITVAMYRACAAVPFLESAVSCSNSTSFHCSRL